MMTAPHGPVLDCAGHLLDLSHPRVMGVLNVTPDSFSDGGTLFADDRLLFDNLVRRAAAMVAAGADILDIGGESTRPGAAPVSVQQELDRVVPAVERLAREFDVVLSIDTSSAEVMSEGARHGAGLINDVRALERPGALAAAATSGLPVCLMHRQGEPTTMQLAPQYGDVVGDVAAYLSSRVAACTTMGIVRDRLLVDPGFGFGKNADHNLTLLDRLPELQALGLPILVGLSRKSLISHVLGRPVHERLAGSLALATIALMRGAHIMRVHDVAETVDAVRLYAAMVARR